ncbi:MAG: DUF2062 domain-containing protein [Rhodospirillaceae bacterium]|nr:DUF2062 domain-containing protein [Rhodospirillaceae bacterium]
MFRRRTQPSAFNLFKVLLWPKSGWTRAVEYLWHRLHRLPGTPHSIAAGLACGSAISVTPFVGVHFFMAGALAWLMRGNVLASAFGTVIGNPWTFPVIWLTTFYLGNFMLGKGFADTDPKFSFSDMFSGLIRSMIEADGALFVDRVWPMWWPMIVGSIPSALLTWILVYSIFYKLVHVYQARYAARCAAKSINGEQI